VILFIAIGLAAGVLAACARGGIVIGPAAHPARQISAADRDRNFAWRLAPFQLAAARPPGVLPARTLNITTRSGIALGSLWRVVGADWHRVSLDHKLQKAFASSVRCSSGLKRSVSYNCQL